MIRRREAGVTLIELLISVTLVALLSTGMLLAIRAGTRTMEKSNEQLVANRRAASVERILEEQVASIMPVKAKCAPVAENAPQTVLFFQGDQQTMRFVSAYSLQEANRGMPMILEFAVIPGDNGEGMRLVVNEHLYTGPLATGSLCSGVIPGETGAMVPQFVPVQTGSGAFVLADKLAYCRFSFRLVPRQELHLPPVWLPHWQNPMLPAGIRIEMAPLKSNAARVQPMSLSIPVHVTRDPMKMDYGY